MAEKIINYKEPITVNKNAKKVVKFTYDLNQDITYIVRKLTKAHDWKVGAWRISVRIGNTEYEVKFDGKQFYEIRIKGHRYYLKRFYEFGDMLAYLVDFGFWHELIARNKIEL